MHCSASYCSCTVAGCIRVGYRTMDQRQSKCYRGYFCGQVYWRKRAGKKVRTVLVGAYCTECNDRPSNVTSSTFVHLLGDVRLDLVGQTLLMFLTSSPVGRPTAADRRLASKTTAVDLSVPRRTTITSTLHHTRRIYTVRRSRSAQLSQAAARYISSTRAN